MSRPRLFQLHHIIKPAQHSVNGALNDDDVRLFLVCLSVCRQHWFLTYARQRAPLLTMMKQSLARAILIHEVDTFVAHLFHKSFPP